MLLIIVCFVFALFVFSMKMMMTFECACVWCGEKGNNHDDKEMEFCLYCGEFAACLSRLFFCFDNSSNSVCGCVSVFSV